MAIPPVVHVIDDDDAVRQSLAFFLGSAQLTVHAYETAIAFLNAIHAVEGGCIVTDVRMPDINGIELLRRLKSLEIGWPVIVVTGTTDVHIAIEAMKQGAVDFIEKPYDSETLIETVRAALGGHNRNALRHSERAEIRTSMAALSPRERQVLDGLISGGSNKAISSDLGLSSRNVEIYRANVMTKMHAKSLSHLVRMAFIAEEL